MIKYISVSFFVFFRVLIGAPRARSLENQKANITGGLYKCEVTQSNNCERIKFDDNGENSACIPT